MRVIKIWFLAQLLNMVPYQFLIINMEAGESWIVLGAIGMISFLGGLLALLAFVIANWVLVNLQLKTTTIFYTSVLLLPAITALVAAYTLTVLDGAPLREWPIMAIPASATFVATICYYRAYVPKSSETIESAQTQILNHENS